MKTNKNTRPTRHTRPAQPRPTPRPRIATPATPRTGCEFLDFCLYPGMTPAITPITYPTAV
jgi:hypothetical protein